MYQITNICLSTRLLNLFDIICICLDTLLKLRLLYYVLLVYIFQNDMAQWIQHLRESASGDGHDIPEKKEREKEKKRSLFKRKK